MTANHFYKIIAPLLKALISLIMTDDFSMLKETDAPKNKGKACDVGTTEDPLLLEMAHKHRSKENISRKRESPIL